MKTNELRSIEEEERMARALGITSQGAWMKWEILYLMLNRVLLFDIFIQIYSKRINIHGNRNQIMKA